MIIARVCVQLVFQHIYIKNKANSKSNVLKFTRLHLAKLDFTNALDFLTACLEMGINISETTKRPFEALVEASDIYSVNLEHTMPIE